MENIDIIIVAGVSFLLVVGGLFFGMYFARRTEAARVARLQEREDRLLAMRAKFEHERFAVSAAVGGGDVELDEDLFRGIKEEIEQERMELDMRREELELDLRMLEEENDRLKSKVTGRSTSDSGDDDIAEEAVIVEEIDAEPDARNFSGIDDADDAVFEEADEEVAARNTVFGEFFFEEEEPEVTVEAREDDEVEADDIDDPDEIDGKAAEAEPRGEQDAPVEDVDSDDEPTAAPEPVGNEPASAADDGWSSEPDIIDDGPAVNVSIGEAVGGDGAVARGDEGERSEPARPAFDHMLTAEDENAVDGSIRQVLGISASDLALMNDLGYGSFRSIADLSDDEITRLAKAFDIPEERIREEWIPDSRMRVAREPRA